jgi:hypothetical protein
MPQIGHRECVRKGLWLGVLCVGLASSHRAAAADASAGCDAANRGSLNMQVPVGGSSAREATFSEGETLTLNVSTKGTAAITVAIDGASARTLHSGRASAVLFVAPSSTSYGFRLDADQAADASVSVTCSSVAKANAERALIDRRKAFLASRDPDRIRIDRPPTQPKAIDSLTPSTTDGALPREVTTSVSLSELAAAMNLGQKHDPSILDFWFEGRYTTYDLDARDNGNFSVMYFGTKYMLGPDIMVGYLAQFDQTVEQTAYDGGVSASGWMAGPYMSIRFGQGVIFDGRAAWGTTEDVPNGIMLDGASADRKLVRGTLRGTRQIGGWTVAPSVGLSYVEDTLAFESAALSDDSPSGTGRLDVLPEVRRRFDLNSETYIEPRLAAGGFLSFDDINRLGPRGITMTDPDLHWKAEAGVAVGVKDSMNLEATGGVETGGESAADNWSGKLQLNMPLGN